MFKRFMASFIFLLAVLSLFGLERHKPEPESLIPSITGDIEYCLTCHQDLPEISASHPVGDFGCIVCHGGERLALDPDLAHSTMRGGKNPSDMLVVEESCGGDECHGGSEVNDRDHIQRVETSIQATYAGAIANIRYSFGAQEKPQALMGIRAVQDEITATLITALTGFHPEQETHPSIIAFAENCLNCHLSADPLPGEEYSRFTGCAACHSPLNSEEEVTHTLTTSIPYTQCNTCHNRGNYSLLDMQFHPRDDHFTGRLHEYYQPIAQFVRCEYTLDCIDCHTRTEAMGDRDLHNYQDEIQYMQCQTCHGTLTELPQFYTIKNENDNALKYANLNPVNDLKVGDTILMTLKGEPLWNTRLLPSGMVELFGKATGQRFVFRPVIGTNCEQESNQQESHYCHECHAIER